MVRSSCTTRLNWRQTTRLGALGLLLPKAMMESSSPWDSRSFVPKGKLASVFLSLCTLSLLALFHGVKQFILYRFGNAMDPSGFIYHEGSISEVYVIYKVDGNSQSTGDPCVHYNEPGRPTPIMVQKVSASDGYTLLGEPQEILAQIPSDGPAIGAPSMTRVSSNSTASGWLYVLFYSSGCSTEPDYTLSYAISADGILNGGQNYTRATAPLLAGCSDNGEMCSPGSPAVQLGAQKILFNASPAGGNEPRQLWVGEISIDAEAGTVSLSL